MSRYQRSMRDALQSVADGQREFDEAVKWEVKITGLPTFYADGKSKGEVKMMLRKLLKRPDEIVSIERTTPAELKKIRRAQIQGTDPTGEDEVKEELLLEDNRVVQLQNEELTVDDIINMIQFGKPFTVVGEDIPATLPPGDPNFPKYKDIPNSVVDKEDKKANKIKDKIEKGTLIPTKTQEGIASGAGKVAGAAIGGALGLGVSPTLGVAAGGGIMKAGAALQKKLDKRKEKVKKENFEMWLEDSEWAQEKRKEKEDSDRLLKIHKEREARYQMQQRKMREAQAKDKKDQNKDPVGKKHEALDTWHPDPEKDKKSTSYKHHVKITSGRPKAQQTDRFGHIKVTPDQLKNLKKEEEEIDEGPPTPKFKPLKHKVYSAAASIPKSAMPKDPGKPAKYKVGKSGMGYGTPTNEVAPPGWGHTKAEKEKTKPNKPKSKIGGSAHEFDKDLKSGKFKGLPGDKTMKDKKASMFKLMWSMKNKGDKPHYKPGVKDQLKAKYKKDESVLDSAKRYLIKNNG